MIQLYTKFYKDLFLQTGGFVPAWPIGQELGIGDMLLIQPNKMIPLGNVGDSYLGLYELTSPGKPSEIKVQGPLSPLPGQWQCQSGIQHSYKSKGSVYEIDGFLFPEDRQGLMVNFFQNGDYLFRCKNPRYAMFDNFEELNFRILQRLASERFNFKEIYVVTAVAEVDSYALAIAGQPSSQLVVSMREDASVLLDDLADTDRTFVVENARGMETVTLRQDGKPQFFKAQKMTLSPKGRHKIDRFLLEQFPESWQPYYSNIMTYTGTDILPSNLLYPASVHEFFHFREMNLNDVEAFLGN